MRSGCLLCFILISVSLAFGQVDVWLDKGRGVPFGDENHAKRFSLLMARDYLEKERG